MSRLFDSVIILAPNAYDRGGLVMLSGEHHVIPIRMFFTVNSGSPL